MKFKEILTIMANFFERKGRKAMGLSPTVGMTARQPNQDLFMAKVYRQINELG